MLKGHPTYAELLNYYQKTPLLVLKRDARIKQLESLLREALPFLPDTNQMQFFPESPMQPLGVRVRGALGT